MPQACFESLNSGICGGASLIGTLDCLYIKTKKMPIYIKFKVAMTSLRRYRSLFTPTWRRFANHLKFDVFTNSAFEFNILSLKRYNFYSCLDVVVIDLYLDLLLHPLGDLIIVPSYTHLQPVVNILKSPR